jgi:serine/threonine protein kinase
MTPPSTVGHHRITLKLGESGMGAVYRATDTKLRREVAIKILPPAFAVDSARMRRLEREAQILASLNRTDANPGAVTRDSERIRASAVDQDNETKLRVLSDWTTLINKREEAK